MAATLLKADPPVAMSRDRSVPLSGVNQSLTVGLQKCTC